ncbi:hypothetical protein T484DRAFT_1837960 [Baffinella frigidus]|nr:hypothetical protein T484DRAFT_1837960 [Cryptophyta sp. CCMP2293]
MEASMESMLRFGDHQVAMIVGNAKIEVELHHEMDLESVVARKCSEFRPAGSRDGTLPSESDAALCRQRLESSLAPLLQERQYDVARQQQREVFVTEERTGELRSMDLFEAARSAMQECGGSDVGRGKAFNPWDPSARECANNHPIFLAFPPVPTLPLQGFVTDFLGVRTRLDLDCKNPSEVPSRRFECERQALLNNAHHSEEPHHSASPGEGGDHSAAQGEGEDAGRGVKRLSWWEVVDAWYPAVDEEYFDWIGATPP